MRVPPSYDAAFIRVIAREPLMCTPFNRAASTKTSCRASRRGPAKLISCGSATPPRTSDAFTSNVLSVVPSKGVGGIVGSPDGAADGAHVPEPSAWMPRAALASAKHRQLPCSKGFRATPCGTQTPVQSSYNTSSSYPWVHVTQSA